MLLFRLARREVPTPIVAMAVTMVAAAASSVHWLARPHLFTLLFFVLFYSSLEHVREGRTRVAGVPYLACFCRRPRYCGPTCTAGSSWAFC